MLRDGLRSQLALPALSIFALLLSILAPVSLTQATAAPALVTCVNLQTGTERISHTGKCRYTQEAQANWHKNPSDSTIASGASAKVITICSNKESSPVTYQVIRSKCAKHQVTIIFSRSGALPNKPVIAEAVSFGYDSASLKLATDPAASPDAPIAFYTITSTTVDTRTPIIVQSQRIYYWKDLSIAISALQASTRYTFTVSATTADGTSPISIASIPVTTQAYVAPASTTSSSSLAVPAFTLSSTTEAKTVNNAITGYSISSTGGTIASYAISPSAPAGITFNTSTGLLSGTPTSTQSATTYTITATNVTGSATATFTLTVSSSTPSFTFSSNTETKVVTTALVGYTISSTGAAITSYSLVGTLPSGLNFSTSNGRITGTPTETRTATTYTIIGTSASGETATATYRLRVTGDIGDVGPGGGVIFYYLAAGFKCGTTRTANCKYLEAAPSGWNGGATDPTAKWANAYGVINNGSSPETATATAIGWGYRNTRAIILAGNTDTGTAAALADSYTVTVGGVLVDDWYLPSLDELNEMYIRRASIGGFADYYYWSSTDSDSNNARRQYFPGGENSTGSGKTAPLYVRPIRAF
jgi:hypothetical protein